MNKAKSIILTVSLLLLALMYILFSQAAGQAVSNAVKVCLNVIIPSTYGFMIISSLIVRTGVHRIISRPFGFVSEHFFKIPKELFSIFIISCFAGYPVGIKMIYELLDRNDINKDTAEYMSCFCFAGGPAFISGTLSMLFSDSRIGITVFASITAGNIITALVWGIFRKYRADKSEISMQCKKLSAEILISSVESSAKSVFVICAMITGFAVFSAIAECLGIFGYAADIVSGFTPFSGKESYNILLTFTEISHITEFSAENSNIIPILAALLSYGGLCVTVQVIALTGGRLNLKKFLSARTFSAVISGLICKLIISRMDIYVSVISLEPHRLHASEYSAVPSVMLVIMTVLLIREMRESTPLDKKS